MKRIAVPLTNGATVWSGGALIEWKLYIVISFSLTLRHTHFSLSQFTMRNFLERFMTFNLRATDQFVQSIDYQIILLVAPYVLVLLLTISNIIT